MAIDVTRGATASATQYPILELNKAKSLVPITKSAAFNLELTGGDYKTLIMMNNVGSSTVSVTFKVGNGIQGVGSDLTVSVPSNTAIAIVLDSGYFKNVSGNAKDCVTITPSGSIVFSFVELPQ